MKSVLLLGLGASHAGWPQFKRHRGQVWTMNDWYAFRGPYEACRRPDRVYNIHHDMIKGEQAILDRGRFADWRNAYDASGAEIVTQADLGCKRQRRFDMKAARALFPDESMWCSTWSYMLADAAMEGYKLIRMERISLFSNDEFMRQAYGTLRMVDAIRKMGVQIIWPFEKATRRIMLDGGNGIAWNETIDINLGYGTKAFAVVKIKRSNTEAKVTKAVKPRKKKAK